MQLILRGPWAAFEQRHLSDLQHIQELTEEANNLRTNVLTITKKYDDLAQELARAKVDLQKESGARERLSAAFEQLQEHQRSQYSELSQSQRLAQHQLEQLRRSSTTTQERLEGELAAVQNENRELKDELAAFTHGRRSATLNLEAAMAALNLSKDGATTFLRELERVKEAAEDTAGRNAQLTSETAILTKQRDSAKEHAQVLMAEHARLLEQCQALKGKAAEFDRLQQRAASRKAGAPRAAAAAAAAAKAEAARIPTRREVLKEAQNIRRSGWI